MKTGHRLVAAIVGLFFLCQALPAQTLRALALQVRQQQAVAWLGQEIPAGALPFTIAYRAARGAAGGWTTASFDGQRVTREDTVLVGDWDHCLRSVLPHEMTHQVLHYHFGFPVPRWADEGAASLAEDESEQARYDAHAAGAIQTRQAYALASLLSLQEYPADDRSVMIMYGQSHSLVEYLVSLKGRKVFLAFVADGYRAKDWNTAAKWHYGLASVDDLEVQWRAYCLRRWSRRRRPQGAGLSAPPGAAITVGPSAPQPSVPAAPPPVEVTPIPSPETQSAFADLQKKIEDLQAAVVKIKPGAKGDPGPPGPPGPPGKDADTRAIQDQVAGLRQQVLEHDQKIALIQQQVNNAAGTSPPAAPSLPAAPPAVSTVPAAPKTRVRIVPQP